MADQLRDRSAAQTRADIQRHVQSLQHLTAEVKADQARGKSFRMSDCGLSAALVVEFSDLYNSDVWSGEHVRRLRLASALPVEEPDAATLATLKSFGVADRGPEAFKPHWLGWMTQQREFFRRCMLKLKRAEGDEFYKVTICQQSPQFVALLDVAWVDVVDRELSPADFWGGDVPTWEHSFRNLWTMRFSDDGVFAADCEVEVLTDVTYCGGGLLCSDSAWQPIAALMADLPIRLAERRDGGSPADSSLDVGPGP